MPTPWNKGKIDVFSKETKEKMSQSHLKNPTKYWLGKKRPEMSGDKHPRPMLGKIAWNKGKSWSEEAKEKMRKAHRGKHYSPKTEFKKGENTGEKATSWKGGICHTRDGYILIYKNVKNYIRRARYVMEEKIGRPLTKREVVHHINEIRDDDRPENLMLFPSIVEHQKYHQKIISNQVSA